MPKDTPKPWGGRFTEPTNSFVERFTASVDFDKRLHHVDIEGSIAHAKMLAETGVLTADESESITNGLKAISDEIDQGSFEWRVSLEDVHMNIEARLVEMIGDIGKKLHTGRSRNDQVATDIRLWLRAAIDSLIETIDETLLALLDKAETNTATIFPGFTHLQIAQPVTFGHHLMAWFEMLLRDRERFCGCRKRLNLSPLGAAALAGTTFPIDREATAAALGFDGVARNSIDAVSDRDFAIEFAGTASLLMIHLSRWCEELVIWNSSPFGLVTLPDAFTTGSSIMPQKKNPDVPELVRGKSGRVVGHLNALLLLMKSQPLAYNKDNQEDKEPLFDIYDTAHDSLIAIRELLPRIQENKARMRELAARGYSTATDLADWLVKNGIPFRKAHEIAGQIVNQAEISKTALHELTLEELNNVNPNYQGFDASVFECLSVEGSVSARSHVGGTAPETVRKAVESAREALQALIT